MIPDPETTPTLSVEEAAEALGIGRSACYECVARGEVPVIRLGRRLRVPTSALRRLVGLDPPVPDVEQDTGSVLPFRGSTG